MSGPLRVDLLVATHSYKLLYLVRTAVTVTTTVRTYILYPGYQQVESKSTVIESRGTALFLVEFYSFYCDISHITPPGLCAPPNDDDIDVDGYKNRTLDSILAAGGCRLTTAGPSRLQRAVVITQ